MATPKLTPAQQQRVILPIALGFVAFIIARFIDGGFLHGFFQGAGVALMILGAFFLGAMLRQQQNHPPRDNDMWRPSDDAASSRADDDLDDTSRGGITDDDSRPDRD